MEKGPVVDVQEEKKMLKSVSFSGGYPSQSTKKDVNGDMDWRRKIERPMPGFSHGRKGIITLKKGPIIVSVVIMTVFFIILTQTEAWNYRHGDTGNYHTNGGRYFLEYNKTYPLTSPWKGKSGGTCYKIGFITDMDTDSKLTKGGKDMWMSFLRSGTIEFDHSSNKVSVKLVETDETAIKLKSKYSQGGRGMELSELIVFNGHVYSVDDRTGIVYEIIEDKAIPWVLLTDGNGKQEKGFKGEWMAIRDNRLYVGGLGKEWTDETGTILHNNPQWVKIIDTKGGIQHEDWAHAYTAMRQESGFTHPGYIIHESAAWSSKHNSWFFLPRRASKDPYDENTDEERGTNILFKCSPDFKNIQIIKIGNLDHRTRGFSSFKFIPGTDERIIVALKSEEYKGTTRSYITVFTIDGQIIMPDKLLSENYKYEGIEFL